MTDLIIVGAGTAGMTAAIYACRAGMTVSLFEKTIYGGQIINTPSIENYPGLPGVAGADFAQALYDQATALGATVNFAEITGTELAGNVKTLHAGQQSSSAKSVILAGGSAPRALDCPGGQAFVGRGLSYCATCDGAFHRGGDVAVIGGGNVAINDALVLSDLCRKVYLVHRSAVFRAEQRALELLRQKDNVEFLPNCVTAELTGATSLQKIAVKNLLTQQLRTLEVSGVFVAIGSVPNTAVYAGQIDLDDRSYIRAGEDCKTNLPGVFAAGDIRAKGIRQLVTAAADGATAALAAKDYVMNWNNAEQ